MTLSDYRTRSSLELPFEETLISHFFPVEKEGYLELVQGEEPQKTKSLKVGVVLSGGQAPGGHNVIIGLFKALKHLHPETQVFGFLGGPKGIFEGNFIELTEEKLAPYLNQGGFDLIGSGRDKIETEEQFLKSTQTLVDMGLDGLVVIGGDDSNTNAADLAEYLEKKQKKITVIGVPKTIDGDLKTEHLELSFGFDTATKVYSEMIGNITRDALSAGKYYFFIKLMGRSASHITLECALQTHPNLALIGEEIAAKQYSLNEVVGKIADLVEERNRLGKDYGVILIPEGLIEFIPGFLDEIREETDVELDPHGNIQVSKIESERFFLKAVEKELKLRNFQGAFKGQPLFYGYEGRCSYPSYFDAQYCGVLGYAAASLLLHQKTGYMAIVKHLSSPVKQWKMGGIKISTLLHEELRKGKMKRVIKKALVDLEGSAFKHFAAKREEWKIADDYHYPGPIQYFGPDNLVQKCPLSIKIESL